MRGLAVMHIDVTPYSQKRVLPILGGFDGSDVRITSVAGSVPGWGMPRETPGHYHSCTKCNLS